MGPDAGQGEGGGGGMAAVLVQCAMPEPVHKQQR